MITLTVYELTEQIWNECDWIIMFTVSIECFYD